MVRLSMAHAAFPAMGTVVTVVAPGDDLARAFGIVRRLFATWEKALSRFRPDSELMRLNQAAGRPFRASPLLVAVLEAALAAAAATAGDFDPTLLPQLVAQGYDRSFDEVRPELDAAPPPVAPGGRWREIRVDRERREIFLPPGVQVEFGGIAKGMAVDAALAALAAEGVEAALVNAGGDLAVLGLPPGRDSWPVAVDGAPRVVVPLRRGALATSSPLRRRWRRGGTDLHHLLHPATGRPGRSDLRSVTAVAATCREAEVAAKVAWLRGAAAGRRFLEAAGLAGLLVHEDGRVEAVGRLRQAEVTT